VENILKIAFIIWIKQDFFGRELHLQVLLHKIDLESRRKRAVYLWLYVQTVLDLTVYQYGLLEMQSNHILFED